MPSEHPSQASSYWPGCLVPVFVSGQGIIGVVLLMTFGGTHKGYQAAQGLSSKVHAMLCNFYQQEHMLSAVYLVT